MIHSFHIKHIERQQGQRADSPRLNSAALAAAYKRLGDRLEQYFRVLPLLFVNAKATEPTAEGLEIWVDSHLDERSVRNLVTSIASDMNEETPGLSLQALDPRQAK